MPLPIDVGAAIERILCTAGRRQVEHEVELSRESDETRRHREIGLDGLDSRRQAQRAAAAPPPLPAVRGFFVGIDGKAQGPLDLAALTQRVKDGVLKADTLVWREGMGAWAAAAQVPEVAALLPRPS